LPRRNILPAEWVRVEALRASPDSSPRNAETRSGLQAAWFNAVFLVAAEEEVNRQDAKTPKGERIQIERRDAEAQRKNAEK
jgi:hypothetical protein